MQQTSGQKHPDSWVQHSGGASRADITYNAPLKFSTNGAPAVLQGWNRFEPQRPAESNAFQCGCTTWNMRNMRLKISTSQMDGGFATGIKIPKLKEPHESALHWTIISKQLTAWHEDGSQRISGYCLRLLLLHRKIASLHAKQASKTLQNRCSQTCTAMKRSAAESSANRI